MKNLLLTLLFCLAVSLGSSAQIQHGYVKTKGRLGNNGKVITGQRLSGATIQIKGRSSVVSGKDGAFSFPIPANTFSLQSVKKQGYVLSDPEATSRTYTYSSNPLILVMETPSQQTEDKLANERKIRRALQLQLQSKEDEIEALKQENRITQLEYQQRLERIYADQENNEKLISEMAKRYSQIDFDQMDELNLRISDCILNGRLTEADSLLRSKGDINVRIARLNQQYEANKQGRENLEKSEAMEQKDRDDIAQDCYNYYQKFAIEHQVDSAAYYLELCASIDTTNASLQVSTGNYIRNYLYDIPLAQSYYQHGLTLAQDQGDNELVTQIYLLIGSTMNQKQEMEYYQKARDFSEQTLGKDHPITAYCYSCIGDIHRIKGDYTMAMENYKKALEIRELALDIDNEASVSAYYKSIGGIHIAQGEHEQAMECFKKALSIDERMYGPDHLTIATDYIEIGETYIGQGNNEQALDYYQKASDIYERILSRYHPYIAGTYNKIAEIQRSIGNYEQTLEYLNKALDIYKQKFGEGTPSVALTYYSIGDTYYKLGDYQKALEYHNNALKNLLDCYQTDNSITAMSYIYIGRVHATMGNDELALEYYKKATEYIEQDSSLSQPSRAQEYYKLAETYNSIQDYRQAIEYYKKAYDIYLKEYGESHKTTLVCYCNLATAYKNLGDYKQALERYTIAYPLMKKTFGEDDPNTLIIKNRLDELLNMEQP